VVLRAKETDLAISQSFSAHGVRHRDYLGRCQINYRRNGGRVFSDLCRARHQHRGIFDTVRDSRAGAARQEHHRRRDRGSSPRRAEGRERPHRRAVKIIFAYSEALLDVPRRRARNDVE
jgi:hypothetical protein